MAANEIQIAKEEAEEVQVKAPLIARDNKYVMIIDIAFLVLAVSLTLFQLYTGLFGLAEFYIQRGIHYMMMLTMSILFLLRGAKTLTPRIIYLTCLAAELTAFVYFWINYDTMRIRMWGVRFLPSDVITGILLVVVTFIIGQRIIGWAMTIISGISIAYLFLGPYMPGILSHSGYRLKFITELSSWSDAGIFSTPMGVAASYLFLFILFGAMIDVMGTGNTLIELAKCLAGKQKGGPAKVAVVSSALMGSISGSPIANVLTTGAFTIPMMKKMGFEPSYAASVEAVASTGGMILPPVMGVLAFAMVDYSGIPYSRIIACAAIPAIMYYLCCFFSVHFHAHKLDMKALSAEDIPSVKKVLKENWLTIVPVLILAVPLCMGFTPLITVSWATLSLIPVSFLGRRDRWLTPKALAACFIKACKNMRTITMPVALAGITSGALAVTGLGVRLSGILLDVANGNLVILLLLVALITIIMGCGLPSLLAYVIQLPITIPAIIAMGVPPVAAHLFVVYYATLAFITPPVGMSLFAAAGLANASYMKTGLNAMKVGLAGFMVPFMFIFCPSLLLLDFNAGVVIDILFAVFATYILAAGTEGYIFSKINPVFRIICIAASIALMMPNRIVGVVALGISAAIIFTSRLSAKKVKVIES